MSGLRPSYASWYSRIETISCSMSLTRATAQHHQRQCDRFCGGVRHEFLAVLSATVSGPIRSRRASTRRSGETSAPTPETLKNGADSWLVDVSKLA
jgi:hypothetical protein